LRPQKSRCRIRLGYCEITQVHGLSDLRELDLSDTKVTAKGVAAFQKAVPACKVVRNGKPQK